MDLCHVDWSKYRWAAREFMVPGVFLNLSVSPLYHPYTDLCFSLCVGYILSGNPGLTASCGEKMALSLLTLNLEVIFIGPVWTIFPLPGPVTVVEALGKRVRGVNRSDPVE